ncbi:hypothetical protein ACFFSH_39320 [Streptomyces filamentosus]|uniref:Uncharacterized protein n=1 Tax=Streptomyces filamentosus TaxID=67294 RepID=A0A919BUJ0_STRFL|nr:hypothetical protein [Streptomyces filamentosus]GHG15314.1 hypothetical protein GCM10017667_56060 [Streptomyces filamentosus]
MNATATQFELWPDDWEQEADRRAGIDPDEQAARDLHAPALYPLHDHGRPCGGGRVPQSRAVDDVLETL